MKSTISLPLTRLTTQLSISPVFGEQICSKTYTASFAFNGSYNPIRIEGFFVA